MRDILFGLWRRWYFVVTFLLLTLGICLFIKQSVPSTYRAQGSLVLMPPSSTVGPEGNPFLFLGGMGQALDILSAEVSAADTAQPILDAYPGTAYIAEPDRSSSGSVIKLVVAGDDRNRVTSALHDVVALVPVTLTAMQDAQKVPDRSRIGLMTLVVADEPTEDTKTRTVSVVAVAGTGIALTVLLTGFIDGRLLARTLRRSLAGPMDSTSRHLRSRRRAIGQPQAGDVEQDCDSPTTFTVESRPGANVRARG